MQLELEGVPIDEADVLLLQGNPGWITVERYGGRVNFDKFRGDIYSDVYTLKLGAVSKNSRKLLAETYLEITVTEGKERRDVFAEKYIEKSIDRENSAKFSIPLKLRSGLEDAELKLDSESILAIDEDGLHKKLTEDEIKIVAKKLVVKREIAKNLRLIMADVISGPDKATVVMQLTSSKEYLENLRKEKSRPHFPNDIKELDINLPEERPSGYVVAVLPAISLASQKLAPVTMLGDMSGAFKYDQKSGVLTQIHRIDFETLSEKDRKFELILNAKGEEGIDSQLKLKFQLTNIDDEPPTMALIEKPVEIPENLPPGDEILRIPIFDTDGVDHLNVELSGLGNENYVASIDNDTIVITTSEKVDIDREKVYAHQLILTVTDRHGNVNSMPVIIHVKDINDNVPISLKEEYKLTIINSWPENTVVEKIMTRDGDFNSEISYSLEDENFKIDKKSGELRIKKDIIGLSTQEGSPYQLSVKATDNGEPPKSIIIPVSIEIKDFMKEALKKKAKPYLDYPQFGDVIKIDENTPENTIIYSAKAHLEGGPEEAENHHHHLKYSLEGGIQTFTLEPIVPGDLPLGQVTASDEDLPPNNAIFYYLLPTCQKNSFNHEFSVGKKSGEIFYKSIGKLEMDQKVLLCVLASPISNAQVENIEFDSNNRSMAQVSVRLIGENSPQLEHLQVENNSIILMGDDLQSLKIPIELEDDKLRDIRFALDTMKFVPATYEKGRHLMSPEGAIRINEKTGGITVAESITDRPDGVYMIKIDAQNKRDQRHLGHFDKQIHFVKDSHKQRYIFGIPPDKMGLEIEEFEKSTVCFHLTKNGMVLDINETMVLFAKAMENERLANLHQHFKVVNLEHCEDKHKVEEQSSLHLPRSIVLAIAGISLLLLILISLCIYVCFVVRYKKHLIKKEEKMKGERYPVYGGKGSNAYLPPIM
ncbi:hypothetical protein WR25_22656 [Diploscapter pachys]|uniref:Cadherin domain-containing protein n=1 Tax=Diploscapter pachys TaxID=2018661 RepID=A0A2A2L2B0_9BILA|nr:hypothetical protein WR25_22656 [Diploscapter pachys]